QVNGAFERAAGGSLAGVLRYSTYPLVSRDIIGDSASCVFDSGLTEAAGSLVKVFGWYDNEWGYACRLADLAALVGARFWLAGRTFPRAAEPGLVERSPFKAERHEGTPRILGWASVFPTISRRPCAGSVWPTTLSTSPAGWSTSRDPCTANHLDATRRVTRYSRQELIAEQVNDALSGVRPLMGEGDPSGFSRIPIARCAVRAPQLLVCSRSPSSPSAHRAHPQRPRAESPGTARPWAAGPARYGGLGHRPPVAYMGPSALGVTPQGLADS